MTATTASALIKALHSAVFLLASACILYALRRGLVGRASRGPLLWSIAIPSLIGVLWWLNGHECLLSSLIYRLAGGDHTQPDIFLPGWIAQRIMPASSALLGMAVALVLWRQMARRWRP